MSILQVIWKYENYYDIMVFSKFIRKIKIKIKMI
jgi:hypothetical protein